MTKYHAIRTERDGFKFASKAEARRYAELKLLEQAGHISDLQLQVRYPLDVNRVRVGYYVADFVYIENGSMVVEDLKGVRTAVYRLKAKLMMAIHGIKIREVEA